MSFQKTARVHTWGVLESDAGGFLRTARRIDANASTRSYFLDGARKISVHDLLERTAENYAISRDPRDYLFEAIRANTTNTPNENNDGFHRSELLRFNTKLGLPVYLTYAGKPHHVNHKTSNPKTARGVIIDSHYNDEYPALDTCPRCSTDTRDRKNLDESGIHCRNCGQVVRDEFVEILVGVDTKKDPKFAEGVRSGQLNAGSMGCNCLSTTCNVCGHVAYSKPEFCVHIRAGNKGSLWRKQGQLWTKTNAIEVERDVKRARYAWNPNDFCFLKTSHGVEVRKAFEYCNDVVFDEYSRVDQPADPKALQREVLKHAGSDVDVSVRVPGGLHTPGYHPTAEDLRQETEGLMRAAVQKKQASSQKTARTFTVIRVAGDPNDTHAGESLKEAMDIAGLDDNDTFGVQVCEVEAEDAAMAVDLFDEDKCRMLDEAKEADVIVQAPSDENVVIKPPDSVSEGQEPQTTEPPGLDTSAPEESTMEEYKETMDTALPGGEDVTPEDMGMSPPGASAPRYARAYADWSAQVSNHGHVQILDGRNTPIMVVRSRLNNASEADRRAFGTSVLQSILELGVVKTAQKHQALMSNHVAQVVDHAIDDMQEFVDKNMHDSTVDENHPDFDETLRSNVPQSTLDDAGRDHVIPAKPKWKSTQQDGAVDHALGMGNGPAQATADDMNSMEDKREPWSEGQDSPLEDGAWDHNEPMSGKKKAHLTALSALGARIAHTSKPGVWTVQAAQLDAQQRVVITAWAPKQAPIRLAEAELLRCWRPVNAKAATKNDQNDKDAQCSADAEKVAETARKAYLAKIEALKAEHLRTVDAAKKDAVKNFCRALRLIARRQEADLEDAPLRRTAEQILASPRILGQDPGTRTQIEFPGMDVELARHLTAQVLVEGHGEHLESLMSRAAAVMHSGEAYLKDAEKDVASLKPAIPPVTAAAVIPVDDVTSRSILTRQAALSGNMAFKSSPALEFETEHRWNHRSAIRNAIQGTKVAHALGAIAPQ